MSERPKRIQRKRTKGWKMPPNTVYVGRPTRWGNPFPFAFSCTEADERAMAVLLYRRWLVDGEKATGGGGLRRVTVLNALGELRGKNLACWCPLDQPCHADVLLEIANQERGS